MPSRLLPLFPLQVVVFPRTQLPLHIFEDRYKEMVGDAIREHSEFGVVLAKDNAIVNAGCTVTVSEVAKTYPDGRMDVVALGRRRFEIVMLNEEKDYLQGEVQFFDDEPDGEPVAALREQALAQYNTLAEVGDTLPHEQADLDDPQLSFQLAQSIRDLDFLNRLLHSRSEAERLRELTDFLAQYVPQQRHVVRMKELAPTNGFSSKHAHLE